jgi:Uma2 family endonuclease
MATKTLMTVAEFAQMHTSETEDFELVEGEVIPSPSATPLHAKIRSILDRLLGGYFERNPIGEPFCEVDCRLAENTVRRPDLSIFLSARLQEIDLKKIPVPFAPDIAVEVLSPSETAIDVNRKVRDYLAGGSKEVWILDHENGELFVHTNGGIRLLGGSDVLESPLLPGFNAPVNDFLTVF